MAWSEYEALATKSSPYFVNLPHLLRAECCMSQGDWKGAEEHIKKTNMQDAVSNHMYSKAVWESTKNQEQALPTLRTALSIMEPWNITKTWGMEDSDDEKLMHYLPIYRATYFEALALMAEITQNFDYLQQIYDILLGEVVNPDNASQRRTLQYQLFRELDALSLMRVQLHLITYFTKLQEKGQAVEAVLAIRKLFLLEAPENGTPQQLPLNTIVRVKALKLLFELLVKSITVNSYDTYLKLNANNNDTLLRQVDDGSDRVSSKTASSVRGPKNQGPSLAKVYTPKSLSDEILTVALCIEKTEDIWNGVITGLGEHGLYKSMMPIFKKGTSLHSEEKYYWYQFGLILIEAGRFNKALKVLNNCIQLDEKDVSLYLINAKLCLNHMPDRVQQAINYAQKAVQLGGFLQNRSYLILGLAQNEFSKQVTSRTEKQKYQTQALESVKTAYKLDKQDYVTLYHLARLYASSQDLRRGFHYVKKSISICSDMPESYILLSLLFTADGNLQLAERTCGAARLMFPDHLKCWYLHARIEEATEGFQRAEQSFKRLGQQIPNASSFVSSATDDPSQLNALQEYKSITKRARQHLILADAYRRMRLYDDCQISIKNAYELVEEVVQGIKEAQQQRSANVLLSDVRLYDELSINTPRSAVTATTANTDRSGPAVSASDQEQNQTGMLFSLVDVASSNNITSDATDSELVYMLKNVSASVHYQQGRYYEEAKGFMAEAISEYETALVDDPDHKQALLQLGVIHYVLNQKYMLAKSYLQAAVRVDPNMYEAWHHLGMVVKHLGELEESCDCFMASLNLEKTSPLIAYDVLLDNHFD
ncbi:tetratricopeptide repeat protein [Acrasis kona]|uniref:Tetratricopeptide repeat protein n=1 Tax=Acrasis kona TaxID=1008807 RepID=A0AAW2ZKW3_9EUKA